MNETLANLTQNWTLPEVNMTAVPSSTEVHDSLFGGIWSFAVGGVQWVLNIVGINATAEQVGWIVLAVMVIAIWRNATRIMRIGEDLFKYGLGIVIVLFVLIVVMGVKVF